MTEEEYFRKNYPGSCYGDKPLSPYWDFFQAGVEFGERQSEKEIEELKAQIEKMKAELHHRLVSPSHGDSDCLDKIIGLDRLWQFGQEF